MWGGMGHDDTASLIRVLESDRERGQAQGHHATTR